MGEKKRNEHGTETVPVKRSGEPRCPTPSERNEAGGSQDLTWISVPMKREEKPVEKVHSGEKEKEAVV